MGKPDFDYEPDEANPLWADGTYSASIFTVQKKTSKAGNQMLEVCLEAYRGAEKKLFWDYIVRPTGIWKLEQLAGAFGAMTEFKKKVFDLKDYVGKSLDITIVTKENPEFGKQNRVTEYMPSTNGTKGGDREVPF